MSCYRLYKTSWKSLSVGFDFSGKEDVICITSGKRKTYQTYIDVDTIAIYYEYKIFGLYVGPLKNTTFA